MVLRERIDRVNIAIMRTFVHLRALLGHPRRSVAQDRATEKRCDAKCSAVFAPLKQKREVAVPRKKEIGFQAKASIQKYPR
jgi:hypothetical protein